MDLPSLHAVAITLRHDSHRSLEWRDNISCFFASVTLTLTRWPWYTTLT